MSGRIATIYPHTALTDRDDLDIIAPDQVAHLHALFLERLQRAPNKTAYREHDGDDWCDYTWSFVAEQIKRWRTALVGEGLQPGDAVALQLRNCLHWVIFEQAALSLGLVVVPLYVADRPDNCNYVIDHSDSRLLLLHTYEDWQALSQAEGDTKQLRRVLILENTKAGDDLVREVSDWLPDRGDEYEAYTPPAEELATIVYTSGTTGRPKGVMLSHANIVNNAYSCVRSVAVCPEDVTLSFLPLSHTLERTVGYYVPMMAGAVVAFNRSIPELVEDLRVIKPTGIITVPRIFERAYTKIKSDIEQGPKWKKALLALTIDIGWARFLHRQGRGPWALRFLLWPLVDVLVAKKIRGGFGGRLAIAISGGAALPYAVGRFFNALGINVLQGYGLTETSPTITTNTIERNRPETIGLPMHGIEVKLGEQDELLARGPNVMLGYWKNPDATRDVFTGDGWLRSGDQARIDDGFLILTGRLKDILVLANGEKVPPTDMEAAIAEDPLFDQSMVIGEQMPYLTALVVLNTGLWHQIARKLHVDADNERALRDERVAAELLGRIQARTHGFPGYAKIRRVSALLEPWTVESGMLTPTLKVKRTKVREHYADRIAELYAGHEVYRDQ